MVYCEHFPLIGRHFSRAVLGGAGAGVLLPAFRNIPNHEDLILFEPTDEVPLQAQPRLYATSSAPRTPLSGTSLPPSLIASLARSAPSLPETKLLPLRTHAA